MAETKTPIELLEKHTVKSDLVEGKGFVLSKINQQDYRLIYQFVQEQYLHVLQKEAPAQVAQYYRAGIGNYNKVYSEQHFEHGKVWHKGSRSLGPAAVTSLSATDFFSHLRRLFGEFQISDEEQYGWPNVYWRLVRPGNRDIGTMHADKWFWDLGHGHMPDGYFRVKLWMALLTSAGQSGLRVVPDSQKKHDWRYHGEQRGNMQKPVIDEPEEELDILNLESQAGDIVLFHDELLHGGMPGKDDLTRLSLEFTLLVPEPC